MPSKRKSSKASKDPPPRKSMRKVKKTARSEWQAEPEAEQQQQQLPLAVDNFLILPNDNDDFYVNNRDKARIIRREEEEESEENENDEDDQDNSDNGEAEDVNLLLLSMHYYFILLQYANYLVT